MEVVKLAVVVSVVSAIKAATGRAGATVVALSPEVLGALSAEQREVLARRLVLPVRAEEGARLTQASGMADSLTLPGADVSPGAVVAALGAWLDAAIASERELERQVEADPEAGVQVDYAGRGEFAHGSPAAALLRVHPTSPALEPARAAAKRKAAAVLAEKRATYLATPPAKLVNDLLAVRPTVADPPVLDDETRAHFAVAKKIAADTLAAREQREKEDRAKKEAADEAKKKAVESATAALAKYALTVDDLAPAAREGYDMRVGVVDHVCEVIAALADGPKGKVLRDETAAWRRTSWDDAASPRAAVIALRNRIVEHVAALSLPPASALEVEVARVQRIEEEDQDGDTTKYRGIVVWVTGPATSARVVIFRAE